MTAASAAFLFFVIGVAVRNRKRPVVAGREYLIGAPAEALEDFDAEGWARVQGRPGACARRAGAPRPAAARQIHRRLGTHSGGGSVINFVLGLVILVIILLALSIKILREYERAVVFFLGRFQRVFGPGLIVIIPGVQQAVRVDLRTRVFDVPPQDVITRDNVSVKVNAVIYFRVVDPRNAIIQVEKFIEATSQLAQTTLRSVLGKHELDQLLSEREQLNLDIQTVLDAQTDAWGIKVSNVEIKHVDLNETMVRAIARQAEAERERRAKVIHAEGELQASEKLLQAAQMLAQKTEAMQLRYLQTLTQIAGDKASTIVFPVPLDLLTPLLAEGEGLTKRLRISAPQCAQWTMPRGLSRNSAPSQRVQKYCAPARAKSRGGGARRLAALAVIGEADDVFHQ